MATIRPLFGAAPFPRKAPSEDRHIAFVGYRFGTEVGENHNYFRRSTPVDPWGEDDDRVRFSVVVLLTRSLRTVGRSEPPRAAVALAEQRLTTAPSEILRSLLTKDALLLTSYGNRHAPSIRYRQRVDGYASRPIRTDRTTACTTEQRATEAIASDFGSSDLAFCLRQRVRAKLSAGCLGRRVNRNVRSRPATLGNFNT